MAEQTARLLERAEEADGPVAVTRLITDHAVDGIFLLGPDGRTTFANPAAVAMFGWSLDELRRHKLHDLIHHQHPDGRAYPMSDCPLGRVFETGESLRLHEDVFFRRDGQAVHVACSNAAIVSGGSVMGGVLIVRDVTEQRRAEERQGLLLGELNHRVKNLLTVVEAIAEQTLRGPELADVRAAFSGRLQALSQAQDLISETGGVAADLREILFRALRPFWDAARMTVEGPAVTLPPRAATALSMAIHELATNATKYGALATAQGRLTLSWRVDQDGEECRRLELLWRENGGPAVQPPVRRGFGTRMIERLLAAEFGGRVRIDFDPSGLCCSLAAPLPIR